LSVTYSVTEYKLDDPEYMCAIFGLFGKWIVSKGDPSPRSQTQVVIYPKGGEATELRSAKYTICPLQTGALEMKKAVGRRGSRAVEEKN